jgi:hypothetical protein
MPCSAPNWKRPLRRLARPLACVRRPCIAEDVLVRVVPQRVFLVDGPGRAGVGRRRRRPDRQEPASGRRRLATPAHPSWHTQAGFASRPTAHPTAPAPRSPHPPLRLSAAWRAASNATRSTGPRHTSKGRSFRLRPYAGASASGRRAQGSTTQQGRGPEQDKVMRRLEANTHDFVQDAKSVHEPRRSRQQPIPHRHLCGPHLHMQRPSDT